jgi:threonine dehydratase
MLPDLAALTAAETVHGQSLGFAGRLHALPVTIVVPHGNSREKNAAMRALGVELIEHGEDFQVARELAEQLAAEHGWHLVPSFDRRLVAGVATYGLELLRAVPDLDTVYVPIGLGSGLFGVLAGLMQERERQAGRKVGVVLSGGNVDRELFAEVLVGAAGAREESGC